MSIFYKTPIPMMFFAFTGLFHLLNNRKNSLFLLLLIWLLIPPFIPCLPNVLRYSNGLRMFLVFIIPFSIITGIGVKIITDYIVTKINEERKKIFIFLTVIFLCGNLSAIASTHPFETLYFNELAGGLGGAQEKHLPDSFDYWLTSYRKITEWLNKNAKANCKVFYFYGSIMPFELYNFIDLFSFRKDISYEHLNDWAKLPKAAHNTYVVATSKKPLPENTNEESWLYDAGFIYKVYKITRQNGEIAAVYYRL